MGLKLRIRRSPPEIAEEKEEAKTADPEAAPKAELHLVGAEGTQLPR